MGAIETSPARPRARGFRVCDRRFPFLWATADQPSARWHDVGEGPCHYLATTPKGACAEVLRHEHITDLEDLLDLELSLWAVDAPAPEGVPRLAGDVLIGDESSYPACRAEARRLQAAGAKGLTAPSAAVLSGEAEQFTVSASGVLTSGRAKTETFVLFAAPLGLVGMPLAEGHPEPSVLGDVRYL